MAGSQVNSLRLLGAAPVELKFRTNEYRRHDNSGYTFKLIVQVPVECLSCEIQGYADHMVLLARTTRIYHDNLASLVGFQQFGEMSRPRAKIDDGIKPLFDILFDSQIVSPILLRCSYITHHQQALHHPVCNFVSDIVHSSTPLPPVSAGCTILLCSLRGAVKHAVHRGGGRCK